MGRIAAVVVGVLQQHLELREERCADLLEPVEGAGRGESALLPAAARAAPAGRT